jgi:hypothetical protein
MITYAFITPIDGTVNFTVSPSDTTMYKDGSTVDGLLVKILPDSITSSEATANKRWNGFAFVDMPEKPNDFYEWEVTNWKFSQERFNKAFRTARDSYLSISDWTQIADSPLNAEVKAEWATYRQLLRDLPSTFTGKERSLDDIAWPTVP